MTNLFGSPIPIQISLARSLFQDVCFGYAKCYVFRYFHATKRSGLDTCCELHDLFKCSFFCSQCQTILDWISVWSHSSVCSLISTWNGQFNTIYLVSFVNGNMEYVFLKRRCWLLFSVDNGFKTAVSLIIKTK